ncbi:L-2-hydroxyglutarate oxidase (EC [Olavius algarvensis associated proteobacterium Delta 3]|nr:L-2-hydroxyglutarate oxidase (EC [Olavius algarvensis associated proteobacterium Delta 3]
MQRYDVVVIGGGIVGLATAMALATRTRLNIGLLEAESSLAAHQTGNNSGVIHSGLYYKPGSLKAKNCVEGRRRMVDFCQEHNIDYDPCGKVVVATSPEEIPPLDELEKRGIANGLRGMRRLGPEALKEIEPHVAGVDGLLVPETGIVDYVLVAEAFARIIREQGGRIFTGTRFLNRRQLSGSQVVETSMGEIQTSYLINCAGLQSDRVARRCGVDPGVRIVPFRGEYYKLRSDRRGLVRNLIYPVPNPEFPFLGVHFTRMVRGDVEAGPNAVLAFKREGYTRTSFSAKDTMDTLTCPGFMSLAARYWRIGVGEFYRSFSKTAFVKALQKLIPAITSADLVPGGAGVRAQALSPSGGLLDDFHIVQDRASIHVLNAPSPAATASICIGETVAGLVEKAMGSK